MTAPEPNQPPQSIVLTKREREVLAHILDGKSNREVGADLGISPRTIEVHRARIMRKLGVRNTVQLVKAALLMQLQEPLRRWRDG
jgi:DNA-binding CsgD family transcriptional regulator